MVSLRSTMAQRLWVIFTIRVNFRKFPANTKFPENLQFYLTRYTTADLLRLEDFYYTCLTLNFDLDFSNVNSEIPQRCSTSIRA